MDAPAFQTLNLEEGSELLPNAGEMEEYGVLCQ